MVKISFHDINFDPGTGFTYSVIAARYNGEWLIVRHRERSTWEIPGGHIEKGETALEAAARELGEETGATGFVVVHVAAYSVVKDGRTGYGHLFFAEVDEIGPLSRSSEIAEVKTCRSLPAELTYPDIQPLLLDEVIRYIQG
ncbi:MAG: NUDIX domain-containing protein [Bacteroidales bacterium]